ncbi:MAG: GGDEF domain-containing protein [Planctomycetota bacterium]
MTPRPSARAVQADLSMVLACSVSPIFLVDDRDQLLAANPAARAFLGLELEGPLPPLRTLLKGALADEDRWSELRRMLARSGAADRVMPFRDAGGEVQEMMVRCGSLAGLAPGLAAEVAPRGGMVVQLDQVTALVHEGKRRVEQGQADALVDLLGTTMSDLEYPLGALRWMAELEEQRLEGSPAELRRPLRSVQKASRHLVGLFDRMRLPDAEGLGEGAMQVVRVMALGTTPPRAAHLIDRLRAQGLRLLFRAGQGVDDVLRAGRSGEVDVILLDQHLPEAEGTALREALEAMDSLLPVVTVEEDLEEVGRALRRLAKREEGIGQGDQVWRRLEELALRDALTGVLNRRAFERFGGQEFARARRYRFPLGLALFDLDHFKEVNDQLGHAAGDRLLQVFASYLQTATRQSDLVARLGGDEFAVLMSHTEGAGALILTQRLRDAAEHHLREVLPPTEPQPGVSVGLAMVPEAEVDDFPAFVDAADQALYRAKRAGRGRMGTD